MTIPLFVTLAKMTRHRGFHRWATTLALFAGILAQYALVLIPTASCALLGGALTGSAFAFVFLVVVGFRKYSTRAPSRTTSRSARWWPSSAAYSNWRNFAGGAGSGNRRGANGEGWRPRRARGQFVGRVGVHAEEPQMSNFRFDLMGESHSTLPLLTRGAPTRRASWSRGRSAPSRGGRRLDRRGSRADVVRVRERLEGFRELSGGVRGGVRRRRIGTGGGGCGTV